MQARTNRVRWALSLLFVLAMGTAAATPSNKWRIQISSDADSDGVVVFGTTGESPTLSLPLSTRWRASSRNRS